MTFESYDEAVAKVTQIGDYTTEKGYKLEIEAVKSGYTTIIVKSQVEGKSATCEVTVIPIPVESISLDKTKLDMTVGDTDKLTATIEPENASDKTITWKSSDETIATVSAEGEVTATGVGTTTILASSSNGKTAECTVTVSPKPVESISLEKSKEIKIGRTDQLIATVLPEDATDKTLTWTSADENIATVDAEGNVTANALGEVDITASCGGVKAICKVKVVPIEVENISLSNTELLMRVGKTADILAFIRPADATDQKLTWTSSDESIATVSIADPDADDVVGGENADGKVIITALKEGKATITAASANGVTATCAVTVVLPIIAVEEISISDEALEMKVGDKHTITAAISPDDATDQKVEWISSDPAVAKVSPEGEVEALSTGKVVITASASNGLKKECTVTVLSLTLSQNNLQIRENRTAELIAILEPDNASERVISWSSSDEGIATVDEHGIVTAIKPGNAIITVSTTPGLSTECNVKVVVNAVEKIELSDSFLELIPDESHQLNALLTPEDASDKTITWISSDESVVTVTKDGVVTAKAVGTAKIYASSSNGLTAECQIDVIGLSISQTELIMEVGETSNIFPIYRPEGAKHQEVNWTSSNEAIATVDADGNVIAKAVGTAVITATSKEHLALKAECKVTVKQNIIAVSGISMLDQLTLKEGETYKLTAKIEPDTASDQTVTWTSSDQTIATVAEDGTVTAVGIGTAVIFASTSNAPTAQCQVTVTARIIHAESITLSPEETELKVGDVVQLIPTITPDNVTDPTLTWESSDDKVATVDENGNVTALEIGETTITVTTENGKTATCVVTVVLTPETGITLTNTYLLMREGYTAELKAIVRPDNATNKDVEWSTADSEIATVDQDGKVTAIKVGTTTITAETTNGHKAICTVVVVAEIMQPVTGISMDNDKLDIFVDDSYQLQAKIEPADATDKTITWISLDEAVATVSADGLVTAHAPGKVTIMASASNGMSATCEVTAKLNTFTDGILIYHVLDENTVEVIGKVDRSIPSINVPVVASYRSATYNNDFTVKAIANDAFKNCTDIEMMYVYAAIESIGSGAYTGCTNLKGIVILVANPPAIAGNPFSEGNVIYVREPDTYRKAANWSDIPNPIRSLLAVEAPADIPRFSKDATTHYAASFIVPGNVVEWRSSNEAIATVDNNGDVTMLNVGVTTLTASCDGLEESMELTVHPQAGDGNWDGVINVADPVNIANYVVKKYDYLSNWNPTAWAGTTWNREFWDGFYSESSDINGQSGINVADISETVSLILAQPVPASAPRKTKGKDSTDANGDALLIGRDASLVADGLSIPVSLQNKKDYVALQADIYVPAEMKLKDVRVGSRGQAHKLTSRRINDRCMRIVLFDANNSVFAQSSEPILELIVDGDMIYAEDIEICNIVAATINSESSYLSCRSDDSSSIDSVVDDNISIKTYVNGLTVFNAGGKKIVICSLDGAIVKSQIAGSDEESFSLTKGVYLVTVGKTTAKVAVK